MRSRVVWFIAALIVGFLTTAPGYAQVGENMLPNGGFESGSIAPYGVYDSDGETTAEVVTDCEGADVPEGPAEGTYCLHVVVPPPAEDEYEYEVGMSDNNYTFNKGRRYTFSCFMKCKSGTLQVRMKPERGEEPYEAYNEVVVDVTPEWMEYSVTTPIMAEKVTPASPTFHFNFSAGDFWIDDVKLYEAEVPDEGATYTWTGAVDLNWNTPANWEVTDSIYNWTWPNEQFMSNRVNEDCDLIEIANGNMVTRAGGLEITGASDGSSEAVLTIDNSSGLKLQNMSIAKGNNVRGRVEVGNGGKLSVNNLSIAQGDGSAGALNVVNAAVNVSGQLTVGGKGAGSIGKMEIENGTAKVGSELFIGRSTGSEGKLEINGGLVQASYVCLGLDSGAAGKLEIKDGALSALSGAGHLVIGQNGSGTAEVNGGAVGVNVLTVGLDSYSTGKLEIAGGSVDIGAVLAVAVLPESAGVVEITGGTLTSSGDLQLTAFGDSAAMSIKGGEVDIANEFQMNYSTGLLSELVMDGGVVNVATKTILNYGAGIDSRADFTLNGGTWNSADTIYVGATPNGGNAYLTINGGTMASSGTLFVGNPGSGESRIILNGGLLQAEDIAIDALSNSLIVYRGGELWINGSAVNETAMQGLIDAGEIDVPDNYEITTIGDYTVLRLPAI